ncbi:hypothetical protein RND71_012105 [Anisodus tanguticus]|uniref:C2H2-type domain-containing protein n=1 Tax=Anisodus tanguticus TaxID=243964 RepID=A0AAE1SF78_9SOLA|nr:hypothetical protein RND71_012105 [Anisodus tanguticus]
MEQQNGRGRVMFQCIKCELLFPSSQSIAAHTKNHMKDDGWVKGTRQRKVFVLYENNQVLQQQQQVAPEIVDTTNVHQADAQNSQNPPSSPARPRPLAREIHLGPRRRSPVHSRPILNAALVRAMLRVPPRFRDRMPNLQGMMHAAHRHLRGRMPNIDNQPQQQQAMVQVPHVAAPAPVAPRLIQGGGLQVAHPINQMVLDGFRGDLYAAFAAWRADNQSTHSSTGSSSTVTVTADPMSGKKNDDQEVEEIDLELRL